MSGCGNGRTWIGGGVAAILAMGMMLSPALAQDKAAPATGADPGSSSTVGASPVVGAGANGNGGVIESQPGTGKMKGPPDAKSGIKAQQPELSK